MAWAEAAVVDVAEAEERLFRHVGKVYTPSGPSGAGDEGLLCPRPGCRQSLARRFSGMRDRLRRGELSLHRSRKLGAIFAQPAKPRLIRIAYDTPPHCMRFDLRHGDAHADFTPFLLRLAVELIKEVRDQAAKKLCAGMPELSDQLERYLIGRGATDADKSSRVQIVPIPSIGHEHADMMIRRLAVYVPQSCPLLVDDLDWAFSQVMRVDDDGVIVWALQRADEDRMVNRFEQRGRLWRSVTPLALPVAQRRRIDPARRARADEAKAGGGTDS